MLPDDQLTRRAMLGAVGAGTAAAIAGCGAVSGRTDDDGSTPPVVDNGGDEERTAEILVTIVGEDGDALSDVEVRLHDRGGTPDDRVGTTGPSGQLRFLESVGPEPCNRLWLTVPAYDAEEPLGCLNGNTTVERELHVERDEQAGPDDSGDIEEPGDTEAPDEPGDTDDSDEPGDTEEPEDVDEAPTDVDYPVVDNGADDPERNVIVDVAVLDPAGEPAGAVPIELEDRGGTPDDRRATTGPDGRIRFVENVGPAPCNRQTLRLPQSDVERSLGCNDGGVSLSATLQQSPADDSPEEPERPPNGDGPIVDNGADEPRRNLRIDLTVVDETGEGIDGANVLLQDRGGTPDDRRGTTGEDGQIVFVESVGPPPCNRQTVVLQEYGIVRELGCNNGGKTISERIVVET